MKERLSVNRLCLSNYRNHRHLKLNISDDPVVIIGENGSGKTNILESISLLSPGKGLRHAKIEEINNNANPSNLFFNNFDINSVYGLLEIEISSSENKNIFSKNIKINERAIKNQTELAKIFNVTWVTPQMDSLFIGSTQNRRKFLDRIVFNFTPDHAVDIVKYEKLMQERAKILKNNINDDAWLSAIEKNMSITAVKIAFNRNYAINSLQEVMNLSDHDFPKAKITIKCDLKEKISTVNSSDLEIELQQKLKDSRQMDFYTKRTNIGVHRSDLQVYHMDNNLPAAICSTGEQKSLLVSIILAEARAKLKQKSFGPVVLLDEVVAHLDEKKRIALFEELLSMGLQFWITSTDKTLFDKLKNRAQILEMRDICQ